MKIEIKIMNYKYVSKLFPNEPEQTYMIFVDADSELFNVDRLNKQTFGIQLTADTKDLSYEKEIKRRKERYIKSFERIFK